MRRWFPVHTLNRWIGLVLFALSLAITVLVGLQIRGILAVPPEQWPINFALYARVILLLGLIILSAALGYRVLSAWTLSYDLDRNGLYINWLGNRAVVPLDQISHVDVGLADVSGWNPLSSIGYASGQRPIGDNRTVYRFATLPNQQCLVLHTPEALYAISPSDAQAFVQDLEQRRNLGSAKTLASAVQPGRRTLDAFWRDRTVRMLVLASFAINLVVLGLLAARYPTLGTLIEMRFNAVGQAAELRPRHDALLLPLAAFLLSVANTVFGVLLYRWQQLGARMLQGASVVAQILFGIAVLTILR